MPSILPTLCCIYSGRTCTHHPSMTSLRIIMRYLHMVCVNEPNKNATYEFFYALLIAVLHDIGDRSPFGCLPSEMSSRMLHMHVFRQSKKHQTIRECVCYCISQCLVIIDRGIPRGEPNRKKHFEHMCAFLAPYALYWPNTNTIGRQSKFTRWARWDEANAQFLYGIDSSRTFPALAQRYKSSRTIPPLLHAEIPPPPPVSLKRMRSSSFHSLSEEEAARYAASLLGDDIQKETDQIKWKDDSFLWSAIEDTKLDALPDDLSEMFF